jgi:hypothetical protein
MSIDYRPMNVLARLAVVGGLSLAGSVAQGVVVTNVTDGTTLFADNFESGTVDSDLGTAVVGSWGPSGDAPGRQTYESLASEGVAPYSGNQFAKLVKDYGGAPNPLYLDTTFNAAAVANSGAGDLLRTEMAFRVNPRGGLGVNTFGIMFVDAAGPAGPRGKNEFMEFQIDDTGALYYTDITTFFTPLAATQAVGAWNTLRIDYVNGSGSFSVSVNGGTPEIVSNGVQANGNATKLLFVNYDSAASAGAYLDSLSNNVPEPASMVLMAAGSVWMLMRRR